MAETGARIAVLGGANMDIGGFSTRALLPGDSNPGRVQISPGGVGRNIAENLARLGLEVELVTAFGGDANGAALIEDCRAKRIGTRYSLIERDARSSVYLFIDDADGDMSCAVNDMEIQSRLTPERFEPLLPALNAMDAVVIDANLPEETIAYLARELRPALLADAVSAAKAKKLAPILGRLSALKPNRLEAEALTGVRISSADDACRAARRLNEMGVARVCLTLGTQGALCAEAGRCVRLSGAPRPMQNATGAGDAFTAALAWAHVRGLTAGEAALAGMAAASIAVAAEAAVSPLMSCESLIQSMAALSACIKREEMI